MSREEYTFRIDRFTPETLPLERLAQYLLELAGLFGNAERVHFKTLKRGSVQVVSAVEREAIPKVRARLQSVHSDAPDEPRQHYQKLNALLGEDNAVGSIKRGSAVVLRFPGREVPAISKVGPFTQHTEIQGELVRVGGRDETAHALIQDLEGRSFRVTLSRPQARELAPYLYGRQLRMSGRGRWERSVTGDWEMIELTLSAWELIEPRTLREGVADLRSIEGSEWVKETDPDDLLKKIRHGNGDAH